MPHKTPDFAVMRDYGLFGIYWVNRDGPPSLEIENRMVDVVHRFILPRHKRVIQFMRSEYSQGASIECRLFYPPDGRRELLFAFSYDDVANRFGVDIWDADEKIAYGSLVIPGEVDL